MDKNEPQSLPHTIEKFDHRCKSQKLEKLLQQNNTTITMWRKADLLRKKR